MDAPITRRQALARTLSLATIALSAPSIYAAVRENSGQLASGALSAAKDRGMIFASYPLGKVKCLYRGAIIHCEGVVTFVSNRLNVNGDPPGELLLDHVDYKHILIDK